MAGIQEVKIQFKADEFICEIHDVDEEWLRLIIMNKRVNKVFVNYVRKEEFFSMFLPDIYKSGKKPLEDIKGY